MDWNSSPFALVPQQPEQFPHAQLDVEQAGLHAGEPFDIGSGGVLLDEFVGGVQGGGKEGEALLQIGDEEGPLGLRGFGKLAQHMHEVSAEIRHGGKQAQNSRTRADFVIEDKQALETAQFLGQRGRAFGGIGGG